MAGKLFSLLIGESRSGNEVEKCPFRVSHLLNVKKKEKAGKCPEKNDGSTGLMGTIASL